MPIEYKHLPLDGHEVSEDPKRASALLDRFCRQVSDLLDVGNRLHIPGVDTASFGYNSQGDFLMVRKNFSLFRFPVYLRICRHS